jgi:hypothetical protein
MPTNDHQRDWREQAREIRTLGDQMHYRLAREEMMRLADKYERLADLTEERARPASRI